MSVCGIRQRRLLLLGRTDEGALTRDDSSSTTPVLSVRGLKTEVRGREGAKLVVGGLDLDLLPGETVCIAGESGSGKSTTAMSIMRLLPEPAARIVGGRVMLGGRDLAALYESQMRRVRGARSR